MLAKFSINTRLLSLFKRQRKDIENIKHNPLNIDGYDEDGKTAK